MDRLWSLTPREFLALQKVHLDSRKELWTLFAGLQATLHNAWLRGKGHRAFTVDDFLPGKPQLSEEDRALHLKTTLEGAGVNLPIVQLPEQLARAEGRSNGA